MEASGPQAIPIYKPGPSPEPELPGSGDGGRIRKLWLLWRERRLFWGVAWKTFLLSSAVALLLPNHYQATVKVVTGENSGNGMMGLLGRLTSGTNSNSSLGLGLDAAGLLGVKTPGAFYVEVLKSRSLQDRLIDRFNLRQRYTLQEQLMERLHLQGWYAKTGNWFPEDYHAARKDLASLTDIDEDKKSNVITVKVTDYDPETAASMANAYVEELNRAAANLNTGDAHREREFLEGRLKQAKQDLDQAALALSQYSSKNTIMDPEIQGRATMEAAARIQGEIVATEAELKGLQQIYSEDNVRVRAATARLAELQVQLRSMTGKSIPASGSGKESSSMPSMSKLPVLGYGYYDLYRQTKIQETVYEFLTQQYEMAKVREAKELPTVRVMDPATKPERKSGPFRSLIVLACVLGGLILTALWITGKDTWEKIPQSDSRRMLAADVADELRRLGGVFRRKTT